MHVIADYGIGKEGKSFGLILDGLVNSDGYLSIGGWWLSDFLADDHSLILHGDMMDIIINSERCLGS